MLEYVSLILFIISSGDLDGMDGVGCRSTYLNEPRVIETSVFFRASSSIFLARREPGGGLNTSD